MAQSAPYTRLSDLFTRGQDSPDQRSVQRALNFFEETLRCIDGMDNDERETLMRLLTAWMVADKFGSHARAAIHGLQKYGLAECLFEDPRWKPSASGSIFVDAQ